MSENHTHIAFADESHYNVGQYRALGVVTLSNDKKNAVEDALYSILDSHSKTEIGWGKIGGDSRVLAAAEDICRQVVDCAGRQEMRVDVLVWDTQDARHDIQGRDDIENLHRMYHHILRVVLMRRWPDDALWLLHLDEHTALKTDKIAFFLEQVDSGFEVLDADLFIQKPQLFWRSYFKIEKVEQAISAEHVLIQVADLLAGMACFSRSQYVDYATWAAQNSHTPLLPGFQVEQSLSRSQLSRFRLLLSFDVLCKQNKLGVSLKSHEGLRTRDPKRPINFWWYEPQGDYDKAPSRNRK